FQVEEFFCRVIQNVEMIEHIEALKDAAIRDFLTGLHNRRYFFDVGAKRYKKVRKQGKPISVAMVDVDYFKKVNDTYGHDAGDEVLVLMSALLKKHFISGEVIARFGGEEFCVMALDTGPEAALELFESLRKLIEAQVINFEQNVIRITASIGLCCDSLPSLHDMVTKSDEMLYEAKTGGRNRVVLHNPGTGS
ncbi:MAG: diguanylate cyclase, partial [Magnetococcales bacterium]|nr:diguanylate cyclase [Magnetococcales bacterium]